MHCDIIAIELVTVRWQERLCISAAAGEVAADQPSTRIQTLLILPR